MSLAKELAFLTSPDPKLFNIDEEIDETAAKLTDKGDFDENVEVSGTKLRRRARLTDDGNDIRRYAGKAVSRIGLEDSDNELLSSSEEGKDGNDIFYSADEENEPSPEKQSSKKIDMSDEDEDEIEEDNEEDTDLASGSEDDSGDDEANLREFNQRMKKENPDLSTSFSFTDDGDYSKYANSDSDVGSEEGDNDDDDEAGQEYSSDSQNDSHSEETADVSMFSTEGGDGGVEQFSKVNVDDEIKRGKAAKNQMHLWDSLLESRIRLQKSVVASNQLPQPDTWKDFTAAGGEDYQLALKQSEQMMKQLLDQLVRLQSLLFLQYPDTSKLVQNQNMTTQQTEPTKTQTAAAQSGNIDDEEITSEEEIDEEKEDVNEEELEQQRQLLKRKMKMKNYPEFMAKRHKLFQPYRDEVIQKWYDKTRIATGKLVKGFSAFESSAVKQIQQIMSDKSRLVKRTQLKRSSYTILGKSSKTKDEDESSDEEDQDKEGQVLRKDYLKDYDEEIFDDDDFYHQLLRQLIERKSTDHDDPLTMTKQWLQIQKYRSKIKRNIDTKASKGRKLRYNKHTKLINFMAPFETCKWTDNARTDLYSSLFGKRQNDSTSEAKAAS